MAGSVTILSRAVDDSGEPRDARGRTHGRRRQLSAAHGGVSIWGTGGSPAITNVNDGQSIEVGVKFRSAIAGNVTAIRFYKGTADTGTHVGTLWSCTGTRLGFASFSGESASGLAAGDAGVAGGDRREHHVRRLVLTPRAGYYVATNGYFVQAFSNPPLTALADGTDGGNGVYKYGASGFPTQTCGQANYWVDVVFTAQARGSGHDPAHRGRHDALQRGDGRFRRPERDRRLQRAARRGHRQRHDRPAPRRRRPRCVPATVTWDPTTELGGPRPVRRPGLLDHLHRHDQGRRRRRHGRGRQPARRRRRAGPSRPCPLRRPGR